MVLLSRFQGKVGEGILYISKAHLQCGTVYTMKGWMSDWLMLEKVGVEVTSIMIESVLNQDSMWFWAQITIHTNRMQGKTIDGCS